MDRMRVSLMIGVQVLGTRSQNGRASVSKGRVQGASRVRGVEAGIE